MIILTTVGALEVCSQLNTNLDRVILTSKDAETLREVIASLTLVGVSEDHPGAVTVGEIIQVPDKNVWCLEMDRTTFKLWFNFEVSHYLNYGKNEFPDPSCWEPGYTAQVKTIKKELGLA